MNRLEPVIIAKIVVTVFCWAGPLLLVPKDWLCAVGLPLEGVPLARLLGWAYLALCVGYVWGLREIRARRQAMGTIVMGIVSNTGAGALLTYYGVTGAWGGWHPAVRVSAWGSAAVALGIAFGLYWFGLAHLRKPTGESEEATR